MDRQLTAIATSESSHDDLIVTLVQQCRMVLSMPDAGVSAITLVLPISATDEAPRIRSACLMIAEEYELQASLSEQPRSVTLRLSQRP